MNEVIPERGVSYYGVMYPDRAAPDFEEMLRHGCNAVLLAVSEFDWWFWRRNVADLVAAARDRGLRTYIDLWGWGKTLAGEPPSLFLMRDVEHRQRAASGRTYHAACLNHGGFREFLKEAIAEIAAETEVDGFFWDEPHYANWHDEDWACRCPTCARLYMEETGEPMPTDLTPRVVAFRERRAVEFLRELSQAVKGVDSGIDVIVCLLPTQSPLIGITDWGRVASIPEIDVFATDPYWFHIGMDRDNGLEFFRATGGRAAELARRHGKRVQLWLQAFRVPRGREAELGEAVTVAAELGVDSIFAWPFRGGEGSILESDDPEAVWEAIGEAYRREAE
ncbi:MAG: hypothetical protein ACE5OO_03490 [Candidatus Bathyarchaeia archaeon]